MRHSTAHLLAHAVKELFPDAQVTIGPVIENGFYYDFAYKRPFTPEDLEAIEKKMAELAKKDIPVERSVMPRDGQASGASYQGIIESAKKKKCDAIFMASHGRRGLAGIIMGSVTHKVLTHSKLPVLVYR